MKFTIEIKSSIFKKAHKETKKMCTGNGKNYKEWFNLILHYNYFDLKYENGYLNKNENEFYENFKTTVKHLKSGF